MKNSDKALKKLIYSDCQRAMIPSTIFYSIEAGFTLLLTVYTATILGEFANAVFKFDVSFGFDTIWKLLICIGISVLILPAVGFAGEVLMFKNALKHDILIFNRFFDKTYASAIEIKEGEAQYRLENDPNDFRSYWQENIVKTIAILVTLSYLLYMALHISWLFTLIIFVISLIKLIVPIAVKKLEAKYDTQIREYSTQVRAYETEITKKPYLIKIYGLKEAFINRLDKIYHEYFKSVHIKNIECKAIASNISSFLDIFCVLAILFVGAILVAAGIILPGEVVAMIGYFSVFNVIIGNIDFIIRTVPIIKNLSDRMIVLYSNAEDLSGTDVAQVSDITATDLNFTYGKKKILCNVYFTIKMNTKTALCGANGSGKSTLLKLLCGLVTNYTGNLKLNNTELREASIKSWRNKIAYAAQEPYLFAGSVKENIRLGNLSATDAEIERLMNKIGIHYLCERTVSMSKNSLSGGEKQKISIARALLKDTPIIILDEPSNNLDSESMIWLKDFIRQSSKTLLFVSHDDQLSNLSNTRITL